MRRFFRSWHHWKMRLRALDLKQKDGGVMSRSQFNPGLSLGFNGKLGCSVVMSTILSTIVLFALPMRAQAPSDCPPPARGEYLLLAPTVSPESQAVVRSKAPSDATIAVCRYLGGTVTRMGGFSWSLRHRCGGSILFARPEST